MCYIQLYEYLYLGIHTLIRGDMVTFVINYA